MRKTQRRHDINAAAKALRALELRKQGYQYAEIAAECGYADRATAYNTVQRELTRSLGEAAESLRTLEVMRLDEMLAALWPLAVRHQELIGEDDDIETIKLKLRGPDKFAIDRVLTIMERRAKLLGLDVEPSPSTGAGHLRREYGVDITQV